MKIEVELTERQVTYLQYGGPWYIGSIRMILDQLRKAIENS